MILKSFSINQSTGEATAVFQLPRDESGQLVSRPSSTGRTNLFGYLPRTNTAVNLPGPNGGPVRITASIETAASSKATK